MKRYRLADFLTDDQKRAMAAHRYLRPGDPTGDELDGEPVLFGGPIPASADDGVTCPLGYLPDRGGLVDSVAPIAIEAALLIIRGMDDRERMSFHVNGCTFFGTTFDADASCDCDAVLLEQIENAANEFIMDWDAGRIAPDELPVALGVQS